MIRYLALALILVPGVITAQNNAKVQKDRTKVLDVAATTPFFTKKGADAVKRVINGADERKEDEKATDPLDKPAAGASQPAAGQAQGNPAQPSPQGQPGQPVIPPPQQAPAPEPVFAWHLVGISYGKQKGMALFESAGKSLTVKDGAVLDSDTKVVSIGKRDVVLVFHGKKLQLTPW